MMFCSLYGWMVSLLEMVFFMAFYHMEKSINLSIFHFKGGEELVINGLDGDSWSYFGALGLII